MLLKHHIKFQFLSQKLLICVAFLMTGIVFSQEVAIKNGVNIQASYYNGGNVNIGWELMQEYPEIEAVRIEIEPDYVHQAIRWIREAHENGYQVIATYHDSQQLGTDSKEELLNAAEWWAKNYLTLSSSGPIIINIMNEWGSHDILPTEYADAYNEAIEIIRTFYSDILIVDVPGFGQATKIAADSYTFFEDQDITFSVHIYTSAFNLEQKRWLAHEDLLYLDATGADCMVGEFCDTETGGADWCSIIDHCYQSGWPLFGWAWNGDGGNMNMIEPHWQDDPLASSFKPTEFLKVITDKLAGIPCYTQPDENCTSDLIGEPCDDDNAYTVDDRYNENCHCVGSYTSILQSNSSEADLIIYPNPVSVSQELSVEFFKIFINGQIRVINGIGETMFSQSINSNQDKISIATSSFSSGLYWISFQSDDSFSITKAIVVN